MQQRFTADQLAFLHGHEMPLFWRLNTNVDLNGNAAKSEVPLMAYALFGPMYLAFLFSEACWLLRRAKMILRHSRSKRVITKVHVPYKYELKFHTDLPSLQVSLGDTAARVSPVCCSVMSFLSNTKTAENHSNKRDQRDDIGVDAGVWGGFTSQTNQLRLMSRAQGFQLGRSCWINNLMSR